MRRPFAIVGAAGSSFFLIGGAAAAIVAILVASLAALVVARRRDDAPANAANMWSKELRKGTVWTVEDQSQES